MKHIGKIIEGIVSQGKLVGSRGSAFRASSSSDASRTDKPGAHSHGVDIGARRNYAHEKAAKERYAESDKKREQEVEKRNREAEKRQKETAKMAKEDMNEARKPGDLMGRKSVQDFLRTRDILSGKKPLETKPAELEKKPAPAVTKEETIEEDVYAKHETDHLKQMHARDVGVISRYKGKMGSGIDDVIDREHAVRKELSKRGHSVEKPKHKLVIEAEVSRGTDARTKIKNVARPEDPAPTSEKSTLSKTGQIKTKIIDEEKPLMSDRNFGLPSGLIQAARHIIEKKDDVKLSGGKTQVDLDPETDDKVEEGESKKKHTVPKTAGEKKLAALASPKDKITHKDVLVGRGVVKEEVEQVDEAKVPVQRAIDSVHRVLGPKSATSFLTHLRPGQDKHTTWNKVNDALQKQGVRTQHIAKISAHVHEEVEQVDEVSKATLGSYVKKVAALPPEKVKPSREKGIEMASKKIHKEEAEEIDEVSKKTLGSYINKASDDATKHSYMAAKTGDLDTAAKASKRIRGIAKATSKLTKEELSVEEIARLAEIAKKFD